MRRRTTIVLNLEHNMQVEEKGNQLSGQGIRSNLQLLTPAAYLLESVNEYLSRFCSNRCLWLRLVGHKSYAKQQKVLSDSRGFNSGFPTEQNLSIAP